MLLRPSEREREREGEREREREDDTSATQPDPFISHAHEVTLHQAQFDSASSDDAASCGSWAPWGRKGRGIIVVTWYSTDLTAATLAPPITTSGMAERMTAPQDIPANALDLQRAAALDLSGSAEGATMSALVSDGRGCIFGGMLW